MTDGIRRAGGQRARWRLTAWRSVARQCAAGVVVAAVVPLCLSQVRFGGFPGLLGSGTAVSSTAADLVLPFLVAAAPLAGLAVRWSGVWAVMVGGVVLIVAGDGLAGLGAGLGAGHAAASAALAISASVLRGCGAGLAFPATAALASGHIVRTGQAQASGPAQASGQAQASGPVDRTGPARRPLPAWWAAVTVASLAVLPGLTATWPATDGWRAAFGPVPLLTAAGFAAAVLGKPLAGQARDRAGAPATSRTAWRARNRAAFPPAQRARLAVLAPPAAALALLTAGVGDRPGRAVAAVAVCEAVALFVLAAMASRGCAGNGLTMACAVTGFVVAPASAELLGLRAMAGVGSPDRLLLAGAVAGAALGAAAALASRAPLTSGGLLLAAAALVAACFAGPFADTAVLGLLAAGVTGGLSGTLARPAGETTAAGAMVGAVLLVSGMLVGSLTAAAIKVQLAQGSVRGLGSAGLVRPAGGHGAAAVPGGLVNASGWGLLAAAAVTVAVALGRSASRARAAAPDRAATESLTLAEAGAPAEAGVPRAGTRVVTRAARHVARSDRRGGKVRPVSG